jgi:hypothetical protein
MKESGIQNPEFRIQNNQAATRFDRFCLSFLLDSEF